MRKITITLLIILSFNSGFSQEVKTEKTTNLTTFSQFEVAIPLIGNPNRNENINQETTDRSWFIPDGISSKFGYGIQHKKWIGVSIHSGIDWKATYKLVAVPIYGNLRLSPGLGNGYRITFQAGFGRGFALGRGNLSGNYTRVSLGFETDEDFIFFVEGSSYNFNLKNENSIGLISLGIALRTF